MGLFVLAYPILEQEDAARITAFRRRHEPARAALVEAHVTLVFGISGVAEAALVRHAAACAAAVAPFGLCLDEVRRFAEPDGGDLKLFLMVGAGRTALERLHGSLYRDALAAERRADLPFEPHVTVASCGTPQACDLAQAEAAGLRLPISGRIDALDVAALEADRNGGKAILRHLARLPLTGPQTADGAP